MSKLALNRKEAAEACGMPEDEFSWLERRGVFPSRRSGRWTEADLDAGLRTLPKTELEGSRVYIIGPASPDFVKIGKALKPDVRRLELQTGHPQELRILGAFEGGINTETAFHRVLAPYRAHGEWFSAGPWLELVLDRARGHYRAEWVIDELRGLLA